MPKHQTGQRHSVAITQYTRDSAREGQGVAVDAGEGLVVVEIVGLPVCVEGLADEAIGEEDGDTVGCCYGEGEVDCVEPAAVETVFGHASVEEEDRELGWNGAEDE